MVMEYWSGWFDLWGNLHHVYAAEGKTYFVLSKETAPIVGRERILFREEHRISGRS